MGRLIPETFYHIYNHANGGDNLFKEDDNYRYFLLQWQKYIQPIAKTYAYCLMPNHFHALVRIRSEDELLKIEKINEQYNLTGLGDLSGHLSKQFSNFFNSYAKAFNKRYNRMGSLFNRPFKAKPIDSDSYLTNIIIYIHHNPIDHGFSKQLEHWPRSSYLPLLKEEDTFLERQYVIDWFGGIEAFVEAHQGPLRHLEVLESYLI